MKEVNEKPNEPFLLRYISRQVELAAFDPFALITVVDSSSSYLFDRTARISRSCDVCLTRYFSTGFAINVA